MVCLPNELSLHIKCDSEPNAKENISSNVKIEIWSYLSPCMVLKAGEARIETDDGWEQNSEENTSKFQNDRRQEWRKLQNKTLHNL
jgi:hypothetical protein